MGLKFTDKDGQMEHARSLMTLKDNIEAELESHVSVLKANNVTMETPLVDGEGFPRADIDIYAVRTARVRIIELRNDLKAVMDSIGKALEGIYNPALAPVVQAPAETLKPFAKVEGIAPGSPAADAALQKGDLIVKFGRLDSSSFTSGSLQPVAELVAENENRAITIRIIRSDQTTYVTLTPRKNWGGRGMLGCHILPYTQS